MKVDEIYSKENWFEILKLIEAKMSEIDNLEKIINENNEIKESWIK